MTTERTFSDWQRGVVAAMLMSGDPGNEWTEYAMKNALEAADRLLALAGKHPRED